MYRIIKKYLLIIIIYISMINVVSSGTYSCCKNFVINNGTLLESFEDRDDWRLGDGVIDNDLNHHLDGNQGIIIGSKGKTMSYATKTISQSFANTKNFVFWFYIYNRTSLKNVQIRISSTANFSDSFDALFPYYSLKDGWNGFVLSKNEFKKIGNESWNRVMVGLRIAIYPLSNNMSDVTFDNFRVNYTARPKLIFTFDDGYRSTIQNTSSMFVNNQKGVVYIVTNNVNKANRLTINDLNILKDRDWDISSHTNNHVDLTNADLYAELNDSANWLISNGFNKSAVHIAYPYGKYNDSVINAIKSFGYATGRSTLYSQNEMHPIASYDIPYVLKGYQIYNSTPIEKIKNAINDTIEQNGLLILIFHDIINNSTDSTQYTYLSSDFSEISNYAALRNSDIDVITLSDYIVTTKDSEYIMPDATIIPSTTINIKEDYEKYLWISIVLIIAILLIIFKNIYMR